MLSEGERAGTLKLKEEMSRMTTSIIQSIQRIANKDPDGYPKYRVKSSSAHTYIVAVDFRDVSYDHAQYGTPWGCTCPARGNCHHVTAVIARRAAEDED
tara:strand:- start:93 stop:389 length:297 start_codon:yes stop_codon:yes gene_type:complete